MRKFRPVAILLVIHIVIAVSLALINPISEYIIRKHGTEYTFATQEAYLCGNFSEYVNISCRLKYGFNEAVYGDIQAEYAIIDTDENSIACISEISDTKPETKDWLDMDGYSVGYISYYNSDELKLDLFSTETQEIITDALFNDKIDSFFDGHEVTVSLSVYKGQSIVNEFYVDGIKAEDFIKNLKG